MRRRRRRLCSTGVTAPPIWRRSACDSCPVPNTISPPLAVMPSSTPSVGNPVAPAPPSSVAWAAGKGGPWVAHRSGQRRPQAPVAPVPPSRAPHALLQRPRGTSAASPTSPPRVLATSARVTRASRRAMVTSRCEARPSMKLSGTTRPSRRHPLLRHAPRPRRRRPPHPHGRAPPRPSRRRTRHAPLRRHTCHPRPPPPRRPHPLPMRRRPRRGHNGRSPRRRGS